MIDHDAIRALYPNVVTIRDEDAFDKDEKPVSYDRKAVEAKSLEMQANAQAVKQSSLDKLAALGLTADDLKNILG